MSEAGAAHALVGAAKRVVVKVGSSSLTKPGPAGGTGLDRSRIDALVDALAAARTEGREVVLVSSGAIAAGIEPLGLKIRPRDLATQQAAASVGQMLLVEAYAASFARYGLRVGQVLLTADDLHRRAHYRNANRTLERLLQLGVVPVINENDAVATDEIRFGDNDRLAALVAHLVAADAMVLLSDVEGVYDGNPRVAGSSLISEIADELGLSAVDTSAKGKSVGTGGMTTKIDSARIASGAGVPVVITSTPLAGPALRGENVGTFVHSRGRRPTLRLFWLRWATTPTGRIVLDDGAVRAIVKRRLSLLPAGVTAVEGSFFADDAVELVDLHGAPVARGLVAYDSEELPALLGKKTGDLGPDHQREVVHRDDIVLL